MMLEIMLIILIMISVGAILGGYIMKCKAPNDNEMNYEGLDLPGLAISLICGVSGGIIPALYAFTATGASTIFAHSLILAFVAAATIISLRSTYPMRTVIKCGISIISYIITIILGFNFNYPQKIFAIMNPEYAKEYGGMNAGDGFGLITIFLPLSLVILIIGICVSSFLSAIKSILKLRKNKKE